MLPRSREAYEAIRRGHKRLTTLGLWNADAGYVADLPYSEGTLEWSLSKADGVQSGRVTVPDYSWMPIVEPGKRTWVHAVTEIEGERWDHGTFPILRAVLNRPRGTVELTLGSWAYRRAQPDGEVATTIGATTQTVKQVVEEYMGHVMPLGRFTVTRDDSKGAKVVTPYELSLGSDVWTALTTHANAVGCVIIVTGRDTGEIRKFDPLAPYHDDVDGLVIGETVAIVADEAVNLVIVQAETSNPEGGTTVFRAERKLTTGPYAYGLGFGEFALVETVRLPAPTQALVEAEAQRIFDRRAGIVRSQQIDIVPVPWVQPGDVIAWRSTANGPLYGMVDSISYPLTARGQMRLTMRDTVIRGRGGDS